MEIIAGPPASCRRSATGIERPSQSRSLVYVRRRSAFSAVFTHGRGVQRRHPRVPVLHPGQLPRQVAGGVFLSPRIHLRVAPPDCPPPPARERVPPARCAAAAGPPRQRVQAPPLAAAGGGG